MRNATLSMQAAMAIKDLWDKANELAKGQGEVADVYYQHRDLIERAVHKVRQHEKERS